MKRIISDKQFVGAYRSAGLEFVALYMEVFLLRIDTLSDSLKKTKLIEEIYNNGDNAFDTNIEGTRTRVNSLIRIIQAGKVIEVLQKVIDSSRVANKNSYAVEEAKNLLSRMKIGEFIIQE